MFDGEQIYLRPLEREDLPLRVKWINDPEIRRTLPFDYPVSLAKTEAWFAKALMDPTKRNFSIVERASGRVIGMAGLIEIEHKHQRAEFYVTIGEKEFWGRGIADEVIAILLHYGFTELNLHKVHLKTLSNNDRARRVYERNGFVQEGLLRAHFFHSGRFLDRYQYGILKSEWLKIKGKLRIAFDDG